MKTRLFLLFFLVLMASHWASGQSFEVPSGYSFQTKEDFSKYEPQVIQAVNWLESVPLNQEVSKRKEVNVFLFKYIEGSPAVSVEMRKYVMDLTQKNPDLLMAFMGGWTRYQLENPSSSDPLKMHMAGVKTMVKIYQLGGAAKDKGVEKLSKMASEQELEAWVKSKLG
jgi:hypothetical protein